MVSTERSERREAQRFILVGRAHLYVTGGTAVPARVVDVSESGCSVLGIRGLRVGQRVLLSLDLEGFPHLRLPATVVRANSDGGEGAAAVRFEVPRSSTHGFERWLAKAWIEHAQPKVLPRALSGQPRRSGGA